MLRQRVTTAIIMVILLGAGIILLPPAGLAVMFALVVMVAAWEWANLSGLSSSLVKSIYTAIILGLMIATSLYSQLLGDLADWNRVKDILGIGCLWWAVALLWVRSFPGSAAIWRSVSMRVVMGVLVLVPAWAALVYLRLHNNGIALLFILIAIVTAADIGAYFSGKAWGNAKLAPNVSPGKSWAGFWGGLAASSGLVVMLWFLFDWVHYHLAAVVAVAVATSLASVLGDLLESMVKREQGVKDSGHILPGHGGVMDRIDSMTAAAPVFALCLLLAGW